MAGFLLGLDDPAVGYVSVVLLPTAEAAALERAVIDKRQALQALGASYSANAYPFSLRYQNCNQWLVEMLRFLMPLKAQRTILTRDAMTFWHSSQPKMMW